MRNANLISQLLSPYIQQFSDEYITPKAHDAINHLQNKWERKNEDYVDISKEIQNLPYKDDVLGVIMGLGGGGISTAGKAIKNVPQTFQTGASIISSLLSGFSE